ncbi:MAG: hypothetical protein ACPGWR_10590 [Ardenticatenaceae bacterium]
MFKRMCFKVLFLVGVLSLTLLFKTSNLNPVQANIEGSFALYLPTIVKPEEQVCFAAPAESNFDLVLHVAANSRHQGTCSEGSPCATIQQAVEVAQASTASNTLIKIAEGTYTGDADAVVNIGSVFVGQSRNLTLVGGYSTSNWSEPCATASQTIVHGQDTRRVFDIISVDDVNVSLQNMTIQNGRVSGVEKVFGGGVLCRNDNPNEPKLINLSLSNLIVKNNVAQGGDVDNNVAGGGIAIFLRCPTTLKNVVFDGNQVIGNDSTPRGTQALGGGLFATEFSHVTGEELIFSNNKALAGSGGVGYKGSDILNRADGLGGGAAFSINTVVNLSNVTASGNQTVGGQGSEFGGFANGGAFFFELSQGTITNGTLRNNSVIGGHSPTGEGGVGGGGAIMLTESTLTLQQLTIVNNTSTGGNGSTAGSAGGGALYSGSSTIIGSNLIIADSVSEAGTGINRFGGGAAIFGQATNLTLTHATIANNRILSTMLAPGIIILSGGRADISYSIVANHVTDKGTSAALGSIFSNGNGNIINMDHNLFFGNTKDTGINPNSGGTLNSTNEFTGDPDFVSANAPNFNYHIGPDSAAIDKATGSPTTNDIDGDVRPVNNGADLGADEYVGTLR